MTNWITIGTYLISKVFFIKSNKEFKNIEIM